MLSEKEMKKIGLSECLEMLGKDFANQYRDLWCCAYGKTLDGYYSYVLGMDTEEPEEFQLGGETPMEFYAIVQIDPETGEVTRDYEHSTLPKKA